MRYDCILWDWNGTIMDDRDMALTIVNNMLDEDGMPPITLTQYYSYLDTPIHNFYSHLYDFSVKPYEAIAEGFHRQYQALAPDGHLAEGIASLIADIRTAGIQQYILTSASTLDVEKLLQTFFIRDFFTAVSGADDRFANSKTERGRELICSLPYTHAVMIGDSLHDMETADAMGTDCILVTWGHQSPADLHASGKPVAETVGQLRTLLCI